MEDDIFGKKWVEVVGNSGSRWGTITAMHSPLRVLMLSHSCCARDLPNTLCRYGFVLLSAWISNTEKTIITAAEIQPNLAEAVADGLGAGGKGCLRITASQVLSYHCLRQDAAIDPPVLQPLTTPGGVEGPCFLQM